MRSKGQVTPPLHGHLFAFRKLDCYRAKRSAASYVLIVAAAVGDAVVAGGGVFVVAAVSSSGPLSMLVGPVVPLFPFDLHSKAFSSVSLCDHTSELRD